MSNPSLENAYAYAAEMQRKAVAKSSNPRYVRRDELRKIVPLADTTIFQMEKRGEFPKRFYLTPRCPVWDLVEVEAWIAQRRAESESGQVEVATVDVRKRKRRPVRR